MKNVLFIISLLVVNCNCFSQVYQWAKNIGSSGDDYGYSIATDTSGNVYITGEFQGTADFDPGLAIANLTAVGSNDIFFAKYDNNGNYLWAKNIGSTNNDEGYSIATDGLGNLYITGFFDGAADFDPGSGTSNLTPVGSYDIFFAKYDNNGNYLWAKNIGSTNNDRSNSIATDGSGNVYITGFFGGTADFDPGSGTANLTQVGGQYDYDIFFAKYDNNGNYLWAKNIGSINSDYGNSIVTDTSGNVYITGFFTGTADFDLGSGTANLTPVGIYDIFFAKYDNNGNYLWAKNIGSTSADYGKNIATNGSGNVYITGYFRGTADFDPGFGTANLTSVGENDIFFAKYDNNGNYLWAKNIGSTNYDYGFSIATDGSGNVYITGYFGGIADFDPSSGTANLMSVGSEDIFFAKYDNNGNYLWAKNIGSITTDVGYSIATDGSGNVYITGSFGGTADFDSGTGIANLTPVGAYDIFFAKYSQTQVGIEGLESVETDVLRIYPNPASDRINILTMEKAKLEIINIQGQIVDTKSLTEKVNNLDISNLSSGVYTLRIKTDRSIAIRKLIKQ